ncbi:lachesin isoform X2 [Drosophila santomea]|uniref:lachesin isoform X2 n=1 Tax=Drosophila santomea TaxID=129105 RepID=UPI001CCDBC40|nr:lachesin isoform X2 [Drosophila santomea]
MKIKIFPLTADAATIAAGRQRRRTAGKLQRKREMPEISCRLIVATATAAVAVASIICLSFSLPGCAAQESDDEGELHHLDQLHHQHQDFIIGESEEHDHIAHHLAEMQNKDELLEDIREDTVVNAIPEKDLPKFGELLQNVTVPVSREAVLQCVVDNLQTYKIAWLRVDTQTILTIQNHVITKNHRMSITHAEKRAWILRIRDVKESDKGWYMCQINTDPMKSQVGYLDVVVPPDILDYPTSTDMVIREGSNVTLKCAATGSPTPTITWRREGGELIPLPNGAEAVAYNGSFLTIAKVNRLNMGAYLCIASNGIPPTVSKRVMLIVHFPPMIWIQNQLVGAALTQNITLECQSEAYPKSINYWMKNDTIIVPGSDHGASYRSDGKSPHLTKHDAKSLTDDLDRMQDLKGWASRLAPVSPILGLSMILGIGFLGPWPG